VRRPLQGKVGLIDQALAAFRGAADEVQARIARAQDKRELDSARETLLSVLAPYDARLLTVYDTDNGPCSEPLEFLSTLYNGEMRPVLLPRQDIGQYLPTPGQLRHRGAGDVAHRDPARGFAAMVSVKDYPANSSPGMLDDLLRLPHEMT